MIDAANMMREFEDMDRRLAIMQSRAEAAECELAALREQTRWIPVGERLPWDKQEIYALDHNGAVSEWRYSKKLVMIFVRHYSHWRPIPELPEGV